MKSLQVNTGSSDIDEPREFTSVAILALTPFLHGYALRRLRSRARADDAVQDTMERAWSARGAFRPGAALKPWMFQILRNVITDGYRRDRLLTEDVDGAEAGRLETQPDQIWRLRYVDTVSALDTLSPDQRRALLLVVFGATTVQAAAVMACPLGTLKSHLRLGRHKLKSAGV
jgi:RNA polymerase sigma-70 factor (ECF subfamily)